tara:strand:+ start:107 stop:523 length:417 start_codon:yes stop_codon:yes gene_type:complete
MANKRNFPNIKPASRSYTPGEYPQAVFTAQNGAITTVRYGNKKTNARLTLGFTNITDTEVVEILNFYEEVNSDYDFIFFGSVHSLAGVTSVDLQRNMREKFGTSVKLRYRFETPPVVTSVQPNRSNVQCKFVGLLDGQ